MDTQKLVSLLGDTDGQLELHRKAKAGDSQSMIDFVRFSVLRKIYQNEAIPEPEKVKTFNELMALVDLTALQETMEKAHG